MTVDFRDYFWGEKNNGFDVLYHNMKHGLVASKDLVEFLRERSTIEETNWKMVSKLAKQTSGTQGTFTPLWTLIRNMAEKLATLHLQMVQKLADLVKDVSKYADELHRKHKVVKEEEGGTLEVVQAIQSTSLSLQKARDSYTQKGIELDKLKKENASLRDIEKAEQKLRKAQDEYKVWVDKYANVKEDFETKMSAACKHFQQVEELHLKQMRDFLTTYAELIEANHDTMGQVHMEFKRQCLEMTVEKLLEQFVLNKYTGLEKPNSLEVDNIIDLPVPETKTQNQPAIKREGFLRSRREKRKEKKANKKKKDAPADNTSNKEEKSDEEKDDKSKTPTPEVDDEGYCIRPKVESWEIDKGSSFNSSSDSDSEDERQKKIRVEIKPLKNGVAQMSASVDELRATVENLSLSPLGAIPARRTSTIARNMIRSQSVSQQMGAKAETVQSPTGSSASTPTGNHPYAPLQSPTPPIIPATNRYADLGDLFSEDTKKSIVIPRPPSRRSEGGIRSPVNLTDSIEFRTSGMLGSSRGPSPLTMGMADTIPLAVAFHEIIHSYFKGTDETKCQVRLCGDMMVSFPAGIVTVLTNNPNPSKLSFNLSNATSIEVLPNKKLVNFDMSSTEENKMFEFNMSALSTLLKRQLEQNPAASYFNVDILKYQIKPKAGAESCPLQLVAYWKCEQNHTDLKIDYKYNSHAMAFPSPLLNLTIAVPVDGDVTNISSKPTATWVPEISRALWKFTELSQHSDNNIGSLRARFEVCNGPSAQSTVAVQFKCEGTTLSGIEFGLSGHGYRISLVKRQFVSGKYICDADPDAKFRYSTPSNLD